MSTVFRNAGYLAFGAGKIYHNAHPRYGEWDDSPQERVRNPKVPKGQSDGIGLLKFAPFDCRDEELDDWQIASYAANEWKKKHDKPFFLAVGFDKAHLPWNVPRKYYEMFPLESIQLPPYREDDLDDLPPAGREFARPETDHEPVVKSGRWKEAIQGYLAAMAYCDMNVGRVLDALEQSGNKDNTVIVLWSDHGWHLGEKHHWRKFTLWEEATRVPMIWVAPGVTTPGTLCNRIVETLSIYPTLTEVCGMPTLQHVEGRSILPLLRDPNAEWEHPALTTWRFNNHAVRTADWRYIRYANGDEELYDEANDPNEWSNLAAKPEFAGRKAELAKHLPAKNAAEIGNGTKRGAKPSLKSE